jgi:chemotaxis protein CheX
MDVKYIEPFIDATYGVFEDFYKEKPELQKPYLVEKNGKHDWDISAVIGIAGESKGVVVISFNAQMAYRLTSILVGHQVTELDDDVVDSIGELVNIVAGNAKKGFESYKLMISLPSIIKGKNHEIAWPNKQIPIIGIPFKLTDGIFNLSIGLEDIIQM